MSPSDEIRYINRKAATQGVKGLSPYQRWVYRGCKGPSPRGRRQVPKGKCPKVKETLTLTRKQIVELRKRWIALRTEVADVADAADGLKCYASDLERELQGIAKLLSLDDL